MSFKYKFKRLLKLFAFFQSQLSIDIEKTCNYLKLKIRAFFLSMNIFNSTKYFEKYNAET